MEHLWYSYMRALDKFPIRTKTATSATISAVGNLSSQLIGSGSIKSGELGTYTLWGILLAPISHTWNKLLVKYGPSSLLFKIVVDHVCYKVPILFVFVAYTELMKGKSLKESVNVAIKRASPTSEIQTTAIKVWPVVQLINFSFVPLKLRVGFMNVTLVFWIIYLALSLKKNTKKTLKDKNE